MSIIGSGKNSGVCVTEETGAMNKSGLSEPSTKPNTNNNSSKPKPPFVPAKDDSKPVLQDPILRSDPIETEEAVLRLPPFSIPTSTSASKIP
ncbi:hypothetical protein RJT34_15913 [Clitoria ternatea]|uniref:Uncharacterized protein n=1 Tax=Clitoria ternatea TaxID=43366 RepID=A0AAN9J699_CLITE